MKGILTVLAGVCLWGRCVLAGPAAATTATNRLVKLPHLRVDLARRQVAFDANVCLRTGFLELLVCRRATRGVQSKEHESILHTDARGADIHAGLILLGLAPGKPAETLPATEGRPAVSLPPRGPELKVTLRWKDKAGRRHQVDAGKWLAAPKGRNRPPADKWVFVGSEVLPDGSYWADSSGDIISVANFASAVIDVPFKSTAVNEFLEFVANTAAIPPRGTPVEVVITPLPGSAHARHARALLDIDRFGRMRIDGSPVAFDKLAEWAKSYLKRHAKGRVVIRAAVGALAADLERAKMELRFAGVEDIQEQRLVPPTRLLPRTSAQAEQALEQFRELFAEPEWANPEPVEAAENELKRIDLELAELKRLESLWKEYRRRLRDQLDKHRAATQPAATAPARPPAKRQRQK